MTSLCNFTRPYSGDFYVPKDRKFNLDADRWNPAFSGKSDQEVVKPQNIEDFLLGHVQNDLIAENYLWEGRPIGLGYRSHYEDLWGIIFIEPYPFSDLSFSIGAISCREKPAYDGLGNGSHDIPWKSRVSGKNIGFCATIMNAGGFHSLPAFFSRVWLQHLFLSYTTEHTIYEVCNNIYDWYT